MNDFLDGKLIRRGVKPINREVTLTLAQGNCVSHRQIRVNLYIQGRRINTLLYELSNLSHQAVLGHDFIHAAKLNTFLSKNRWTFEGDSKLYGFCAPSRRFLSEKTKFFPVAENLLGHEKKNDSMQFVTRRTHAELHSREVKKAKCKFDRKDVTNSFFKRRKNRP